jgi:HPr kinase/phosphorylase
MAADLGLSVLAGRNGLERTIENDDLNRPGLELAGFLKFFDPTKVQVIGEKEVDYLTGLEPAQREEAIDRLMAYPLPAVIFTSGISTVKYFSFYAEERNIPLLRTEESTTKFSVRLHSYLERMLAPQTGVHGTFVEVYGIGILLRGVSGIGKSEVALSLIEKGHRLIADDHVTLTRISPDVLIGSPTEINENFLSIRGVGLLNVRELYGAGAIRENAPLNQEIELVPWDDRVHYDALGIENRQVEYLQVSVPKIILPVKPGRDLAELVQVTAKNYRLKQQGYDPQKEFFARLQRNWGNQDRDHLT